MNISFDFNGFSTSRNISNYYSSSRLILDVILSSSYVLIFLLAIIGNMIVIGTLVRYRQMWTITNLLLLNLAISDISTAIISIPSTILAYILRRYVLGGFICISQRYFQGVCVAVSMYTLMIISLERYFAITKPLTSRIWQTNVHVHKIITGIWLVSMIIMIPLAIVNKLQTLKRVNTYKCEEDWYNNEYLKMIYSIAQMVILFVIPLCIMIYCYSMIARTLKLASLSIINQSASEKNKSSSKQRRCLFKSQKQISSSRNYKTNHVNQKIIKMLLIVVVEFFICWSPVFILNTWLSIDPKTATQLISPGVRISATLISYVSCCCNPITYCFMHDKFRFYLFQSCGCPQATRTATFSTKLNNRSVAATKSAVNRQK